MTIPDHTYSFLSRRIAIVPDRVEICVTQLLEPSEPCLYNKSSAVGLDWSADLSNRFFGAWTPAS